MINTFFTTIYSLTHLLLLSLSLSLFTQLHFRTLHSFQHCEHPISTTFQITTTTTTHRRIISLSTLENTFFALFSDAPLHQRKTFATVYQQMSASSSSTCVNPLFLKTVWLFGLQLAVEIGMTMNWQDLLLLLLAKWKCIFGIFNSRVKVGRQYS